MDKATIQAHKISDEEYEEILKILGREPNLLELGIFSAITAATNQAKNT